MNRLMRSKRDKIFLGVCGGIGEYFNIDPTLIRLLFIFFVFISFRIAVAVYIIAAFVMPERSDTEYDENIDVDMDERNASIRRNTPIVLGIGLIVWGAYLLTKLIFPSIFIQLRHQFRFIWNFWPVALILLGLYVIIQNKNK